MDHLIAVHSTVEEPESIEMAELAQIQPLEASQLLERYLEFETQQALLSFDEIAALRRRLKQVRRQQQALIGLNKEQTTLETFFSGN